MDRYLINSQDFVDLLKHLFSQNIIEEVLSAEEKKNHYSLIPKFITSADSLESFPLSQLLVYSYQRTDTAANTILHSQEALKKKVAVIGHACDIRALVELKKKQQVKWENLFLISYEDVGFLEVKVLTKFFKKQGIDPSEIQSERLTPDYFILKMKDGSIKKFKLPDDINLAANCTRCIRKEHYLADFLISIYGLPEDSDDYIITPQSDRAKKIVEELKWTNKKISEAQEIKYDEVKTALLDRCQVKRDNDLKDWNEMPGPERLKILAKCTGCGMCVTSCAVCYCRDCNLLTQVRAKTMDKVNFIINRFPHVGDTCIECGRCESNCPVNIPLTLVFGTLREKFKAKKSYEAGMDLDKVVMHLDV